MLIAGNWKMYKAADEARRFCRGAARAPRGLDGVDVAVCPPFTRARRGGAALAGTEIAVAAQNVHWEPEGAFTGEISAPMLRELASTARSSATRSGGSTSARPTRRSRAGRRAALDAGLCA